MPLVSTESLTHSRECQFIPETCSRRPFSHQNPNTCISDQFLALFWSSCVSFPGFGMTWRWRDPCLTSDGDDGERFAVAHVVGGNASVRPAVGHFELSDRQHAFLGDLCPWRYRSPAHTWPLEADWVRAMGDTLHTQRGATTSGHMIRNGGGIRRSYNVRNFTCIYYDL